MGKDTRIETSVAIRVRVASSDALVGQFMTTFNGMRQGRQKHQILTHAYFLIRLKTEAVSI